MICFTLSLIYLILVRLPGVGSNLNAATFREGRQEDFQQSAPCAYVLRKADFKREVNAIRSTSLGPVATG